MSNKRVADALAARERVIKASEQEERLSGSLPCAVCGHGMVQWFILPNTHVHMQCTTTGCISWME